MVTYLGSLVQLCCGEGGTLKTNITGVCGECSQCMDHTGFAPARSTCAFPVYTAQAPGCSEGESSKVGPGFHALPRSKLLRFRSGVLHKGTGPTGPAFCALPGQRSSGNQVLGERTVPGTWRILSPPPTQPLRFLSAPQKRCLRSAVCLLWGADVRL